MSSCEIWSQLRVIETLGMKYGGPLDVTSLSLKSSWGFWLRRNERKLVLNKLATKDTYKNNKNTQELSSRRACSATTESITARRSANNEDPRTASPRRDGS